MNKIILFITFFILIIVGLSKALDLDCKYGKKYDYEIGDIYKCEVTNDPNITTPESTQISSITGKHRKRKDDSDVTAFNIYLKTVNYFPKNLSDFFKNLKVVEISNCHLKEIHQSDLKELQQLEVLDFSANDLKVIEEGLFDFNPKLVSISFYENKLVHIDPNVFDNLPALRVLRLIDSGCEIPIIESRTLTSLLKEVNDRCVNLEYLSPVKKAKYLEYQEHKQQQEIDFTTRENTITCDFSKKLGTIYSGFTFWCQVKYNPNIITHESAQINSVFEINDKYEADNLTVRDDVVKFDAHNQVINYFPRGLEKFFTNLNQITINSCQLKEIHQADLKLYAKLTDLSLIGNLLEVIEDHLFDFNENLSSIYLNDNKIIHIGANSFSKIRSLNVLYLFGVQCLEKSWAKAANDAGGVQSMINDVLTKYCFNPDS